MGEEAKRRGEQAFELQTGGLDVHLPFQVQALAMPSTGGTSKKWKRVSHWRRTQLAANLTNRGAVLRGLPRKRRSRHTEALENLEEALTPPGRRRLDCSPASTAEATLWQTLYITATVLRDVGEEGREPVETFGRLSMVSRSAPPSTAGGRRLGGYFDVHLPFQVGEPRWAMLLSRPDFQ